MAKGRRQRESASERLLGYAAFSGADVGRAVGDLQDLAEDEVLFASFFACHDEEDFGPNFPGHDVSDPDRFRRRLPARERRVGGLSLAFEVGHDVDAQGATVVHRHHGVETAAQQPQSRSAAASAPVNVPTWPSRLRLVSADSPGARPPAWPSDDDGDDESGWLPPHEYLAQEHRKGAVATSVFEGVGRTLKGRDMSRVRDAVWSQTKFFG